MKPAVLVTRRIYPEAIEYLKQRADVDYVDSDDGLTDEELLRRIRGKQAVVSQLTEKFPPAVIDKLDGVLIIANVAVGVFKSNPGAPNPRANSEFQIPHFPAATRPH